MVLPVSAALGHPHQLPASPNQAGGCMAHRWLAGVEVSAPASQRCAMQSAKGGTPEKVLPPPSPPHCHDLRASPRNPSLPAAHLRTARRGCGRGAGQIAGRPARRRGGLLHGHVRAAHGRGRPAPPPPPASSSSFFFSSSSSAQGGRGGAPRSPGCQRIFGARRAPLPHL